MERQDDTSEAQKRAANAAAAARYRERQRTAGLVLVRAWIRPEYAEKARAYLARLAKSR